MNEKTTTRQETIRYYERAMTYFLFLLAVFLIIAPLFESGMRAIAAAFFMAAWISLFGLVGYILLG